MSPKKQPRSKKEINAAKKAAVLGQKGKTTNPVIYFAIGAAVLALALVGAALFYPWGGGQVVATGQGPTTGANLVSFAAADFADGRARYYSYQAPSGQTIRFFVLKSSDSVIRAAFDACDVCWRSGKGYQQEGDYMVCRNCGRRFASVRVNVEQGGCNPAPLNRIVKDGKVLIAVADILSGKQYFDF